MDISLRVLKEPRGFIRIIQCAMAIFAFSMTASFSSKGAFKVVCQGKDDFLVKYDFGYPFSKEIILMVPDNCNETDPKRHVWDFNDASSAQFFVATGVLSFLYSISILIVYTCCHRLYANEWKVPVLDLAISSLLAAFWLAGSSAWAEGVRSLKLYFNPDTIAKMLYVCQLGNDNDQSDLGCKSIEKGSYGVIHASLVLGFANFALWTFGIWFVYKETMFHTPQQGTSEPGQNQTPKTAARV